MSATAEDIETFAPLQWATQYLTSPDWVVKDRTRGSRPDDDTDRFCRDTMSGNNGVQRWIELYEKPAPGEKVSRSISLCKFGRGLTGFPGIAHGGALLTLMDEGLAYVMVANEVIDNGGFADAGDQPWRKLLEEGRPPTEVLNGMMVTAKFDVKFLKPVLCPGIVGIEVNMLENRGSLMKMRGVMKDEKGTPLLQVDGVWIRIGKAAKL